jgi:hypothetical protein
MQVCCADDATISSAEFSGPVLPAGFHATGIPAARAVDADTNP